MVQLRKKTRCDLVSLVGCGCDVIKMCEEKRLYIFGKFAEIHTTLSFKR